MRLDAMLAFVPLGAPLSIVGGAGVAIPSTNVIDMLGLGVGQAPQSIIGNVTNFGTDMGIGGFRPELEVAVGTAFTTGNAATLNVAFQAAPDQGAAGGYQPGTWTTLEETGPMAVANLTANQIIARFPWVPAFPANLRARFLRLLFSPAAGTNFTAGTIAFAIPTPVRDDLANKYAARNYTVA
ncbi:hypothetical protein FHT86_002155 [Rhizobium sp. BK313]|uniref:hypothetical protein n=1 Tax=Rhizobium sp. BK313 TaxID=2587081 RepID=UPI0016173DD0|nr:hypothetical protein [Rhizobium sp. BK313]MBB3453899.1 hypothetical protein [Rhizobium sp. BK313]